MEITKKEDHVLFKNSKGEYHLDIKEFEEMGEKKAKAFAKEEIEKKFKSGTYSELEIDFDKARNLGFCEYGIKDFCKRLDLDIEESHTIKSLLSKLDKHTFFEYSSECLKLFGNVVFDKFGGPIQILKENKTAKVRDLILNSDLLTDKQKHILSVKFSERTLKNFEDKFPEDKRPRNAIEVKKEWIKEKYGDFNY